MLSGLGFVLVRASEERNESNMNEKTVFLADLKRYLSDSLKERLTLNITDRTADLGDNYVCICLFAYSVNKFLDLVCDMRNNLNC